MASGATSKYALPYPQPSDTPNIPADVQALAQLLDALIATAAADTAANRPAAGKFGRVFRAADTGALSFDTGSTWLALGMLGGSAATLKSVVPGSAPDLGTSPFGSRLDHVHEMDALPLATAPVGLGAAGPLTARTVAIEILAPRAMSIAGYQARVAVGSGTTVQLLVDGAAVSSSGSAALDQTVRSKTFTPVAVARGQRLGVQITAAGTSASDLSLMLDATFTA